jgi:hypothetical protein
MARVDGPSGPRLRFGVVHPEDAGRWRAENKGRTVELDAAGAAKLRDVLANAQVDGKKSVADFRAALRAARAAGVPESKWPDSEAEIASGVVPGARWGDLHWKLTREAGPDYVAGGVNYGAGGEWNLALDPTPTGATGSRDNFDATAASTVTKLDKAIANLIGTQ